MRQRGKNNESTGSLVLDPSVSLVRPATAVHAKTRKISSVLLSRIAKDAAIHKPFSKAFVLATTRKRSPAAFHTSMLLTQKHSALKAEVQHSSRSRPLLSAKAENGRRLPHARAMSGEVGRYLSPVVTLVSEDSKEDGPPSELRHRHQVGERLQDLLYNFSSQLSLVYEPKQRSALPLRSQLRRHRDFIARLQSDRFSGSLLKRAVFQAWKGATHNPRFM